MLFKGQINGQDDEIMRLVMNNHTLRIVVMSDMAKLFSISSNQFHKTYEILKSKKLEFDISDYRHISQFLRIIEERNPLFALWLDHNAIKSETIISSFVNSGIIGIKKLIKYNRSETPYSQNIFSDVTPFEVDGDLYLKLQERHLLHSFGNMLFNLSGLQIENLASSYDIVLDFFGNSDRCINMIEKNLMSSDFAITCLKPTEELLEKYSGCEDKTGSCLLDVSDTYYFFFGDRNPYYAYQIREILTVKKDKVMAAIEFLQSSLSDRISVLKTQGNSISNSEQTQQLVNELALVAQAKDCVHKYISSIQEMLKENLQERNKLFIEKYPFYKDI